MGLREDMRKELNKFLKKESNKDVVIDRANFEEYLVIIKEELRLFHTQVSALTGKEREKIGTLLKVMYKNKKLLGVTAYLNYKGSLKGDAFKAEHKSVFESLIASTKKSEKIIDSLIDSHTDNFVGKTITINSTRTTNLMVMGTARRLDDLSQFAIMLFGAVSINLVDPSVVIPTYRIYRLNELNTSIATHINEVYSKKGASELAAQIASVKKSNNDIKILDENYVPNSGFIGNLFPNIANIITFGLFNLNIFRYLGEMWITYQHSIYEKQEAERLWIGNHVTLLKLELEDPNDTQDKKHLKQVISKYSDKLTILDRKIAEYRGEE